ncbi:hypothetical protein RUND412_010568 [Rhizina undulata]
MLFRFTSSLTAAVAFFASVNASPTHKPTTNSHAAANYLGWPGFKFILNGPGPIQSNTVKINPLDKKIYISNETLDFPNNLQGDIVPIDGIPGTSGFQIYTLLPTPELPPPWLTINPDDNHLEYGFNLPLSPIQGFFTKWQWSEDGAFLTYGGFEGGFACQTSDGWQLYFALQFPFPECPDGQGDLPVQWRRVPAIPITDELR